MHGTELLPLVEEAKKMEIKAASLTTTLHRHPRIERKGPNMWAY